VRVAWSDKLSPSRMRWLVAEKEMRVKSKDDTISFVVDSITDHEVVVIG
jgi:hypothetical protein